jgi:sec-independent protein translocase protein TatB
MNGTILNLGPLEILAILIMALLVLGPERLPGLMRGFGTALRRIREMYVGFVTEFRAELQPIAEEVDSVTREIQGELAAIREAADIRSVLQPVSEDLTKATDLSRPVTPSSPAPGSGPAAQIDAPAWGYSQLNDGQAAADNPADAPGAEAAVDTVVDTAAQPDPVIAPPRAMTVEEAILGPHREAQRAAAALAAAEMPAVDDATAAGVLGSTAPEAAASNIKRAAPFSIDEPQPVMDTSAASFQMHRHMLMASFSRTQIELKPDNPWRLFETPVRSDQLDEDSPWKG